MFHESYAAPSSALRVHNLDNGPRSLLTHLDLIRRCNGLQEAIMAVTDGYKYAQVNFRGVAPNSRLPTVEFRYFSGTNDSVLISAYAKLVMGLVEKAHLATPAEMAKLVFRMLDRSFIFPICWPPSTARISCPRLLHCRRPPQRFGVWRPRWTPFDLTPTRLWAHRAGQARR